MKENNKYIFIDGKETKIKNIIGQKFGKLTIVDFDYQKYNENKIRYKNGEIKNVRPYWYCKCDCGNENLISVQLANLKRYKLPNCGCVTKRSIKENLIGKNFGRLVVIKEVKSRITKGGQTKSRWLCECECGNFKEVDSEKLKSGEVKSCGCLNRELTSKRTLKDLTGVKFGELTVIKRSEDYISPKGKHVVMWNCLCNCGNYTTVAVNSLRNGGTTSCGCVHDEVTAKANREYAIAKNGSLGDWILENLPKDFLELYWSKNNKISPFNTPYAGTDKIYIICSECKKEYSLTTYSFTSRGQRCPDCSLPKGEREIKKVLDPSNVKYDIHREFDGLIGLGNGLLSYDFYLPHYNLLIEYQGNFHDGSNGEYTQINLEKQQEHDRRKREYANKNNIKLLEIWYWDFDNIEEILKKELKLN